MINKLIKINYDVRKIYKNYYWSSKLYLRKDLDTRIHKVKGITRTESFLSIEESFKEVLSLNN